MAILGTNSGQKSTYASVDMVEMYPDETVILTTEAYTVDTFVVPADNSISLGSHSNYSSTDMIEMYPDETLGFESESYTIENFAFTTTDLQPVSQPEGGTVVQSKQTWIG